MGMTAAFLLMKDDGARLSVQTQLALDLLYGGLECLNGYPFSRGWAEAQGEEGLLGTRTLTYGMDFLEGGTKVISHKAAQLMHLDMLIFVCS